MRIVIVETSPEIEDQLKALAQKDEMVDAPPNGEGVSYVLTISQEEILNCAFAATTAQKLLWAGVEHHRDDYFSPPSPERQHAEILELRALRNETSGVDAEKALALAEAFLQRPPPKNWTEALADRKAADALALLVIKAEQR